MYNPNLMQLNYTRSKEMVIDMLKTAYEPEGDYYSKVNIVKSRRGKFSPAGFFGTNMPEKFNPSIVGKSNIYICKNGMTDPGKWDSEGLSTLHVIMMDLDCHHTEMPYSEVYAAVECLYQFLLEDEIYPNVVCITGRGVQLWWFIKPVPALENLIGIYQVIVQRLIDSVENILKKKLPAVMRRDKLRMSVDRYNSMEALRKFDIDVAATKNPSGLVRFPGTYNTNAGRFGEFSFQHKDRMDILQEYFSDRNLDTVKKFVPNKDKTKQAKRKRRVTEINPHSDDLAKKRETMLSGLVSARKENGETLEHYRNYILLFLTAAYISTGYTQEETLEAVFNMNREFDKPMPHREVLSYMSTALQKGYWYTNARIIETLDMTEEEQMQLGFYPCDKKMTEIAMEKRQRRKERNNKILEMAQAGMTQVEIATKIGVSQSTVCRLLNKNGIIKKTKQVTKEVTKRVNKRKDLIEQLLAEKKSNSNSFCVPKICTWVTHLKKYAFFTLFINSICLQKNEVGYRRLIADAPGHYLIL